MKRVSDLCGKLWWMMAKSVLVLPATAFAAGYRRIMEVVCPDVLISKTARIFQKFGVVHTEFRANLSHVTPTVNAAPDTPVIGTSDWCSGGMGLEYRLFGFFFFFVAFRSPPYKC